MLCILGRELHYDRKNQQRTYVQIPDSRLYFKDRMWDLFCIITNDTGKTRDHRNRILGAGITAGIFDRSVGEFISINPLSGKLVFLYRDQTSAEDSGMVSEIFTSFCNSGLYFNTGNQAALYYRCIWWDYFK